eukprot:scaffold247_cov274-Pinguiococcus_pyrenoidosus.AAC.15
MKTIQEWDTLVEALHGSNAIHQAHILSAGMQSILDPPDPTLQVPALTAAVPSRPFYVIQRMRPWSK